MASRDVIVLQIFLISSMNALSNIDIQQPTICMKERSDTGGKKSIDTSANDFKNFVQNSDIFVDKSLLVNIVAQNKSLVSLTFPPKWGKSINLDMLKTFLQIEVDSKGIAKPSNTTWSYKFFKLGEITYDDKTSSKMTHPPIIAKNEYLVNSYLGQYPVIYLTLSSFDSMTSDYEGYLKSFRTRVAAEFQRHEYVVDLLDDEIDESGTSHRKKQATKKLLEKFKEYKSGRVKSDQDVITSLNFLSSILKSHFNQPAYVLIDDYDALVRKSCLQTPSPSDEETEKILRFFHKFISSTFVTNKNLRMGIVTGILDLDVFSDPSNSFASVNYNLLNKNTRPCHGFTTNEISQLLAHCFIEHNTIEKALKYYKGYHVADFPEIVVYDPWSIVNLVNNRKIDDYQYDIMVPQISRLFGFEPSFQYLIEMNIFLFDQVAETDLHSLKFDNEDLMLLKNATRGIKHFGNVDRVLHLMFTYLYAIGYFTLHAPVEFTNRISRVKIEGPNEPQKKEILKKLVNKLPATTPLNKWESDAINYVARRFFECQYSMGNNWKDETLGKLYETALSGNPFITKLDNLHLLHVHILLCMKLNFGYIVWFNAGYKKDEQNPSPYAVLWKKDHTAIIEFELADASTNYGVSGLSNVALDRAKTFNNIFKNGPLISTTFLGIGIVRFSFGFMTYIQSYTNPKRD